MWDVGWESMLLSVVGRQSGAQQPKAHVRHFRNDILRYTTPKRTVLWLTDI
jgi:hypothetical protein